MIWKNKLIVGTALLVVICLIASSVFVYFEFFAEEKEIPEKEPIEFKLDDRISPNINQGLIIEVNRIRNRDLMDFMYQFSKSWKYPPSYFYTINVDGGVGSAEGRIGEDGLFNVWDTFGRESSMSFYIESEQETSEVTISIVEKVTTGIIFKKTADVVKETIHVVYDYRTARWTGDDEFGDTDGLGHFLGDTYEVWFNIYQGDYDHDYIPYWTEVNVLGTDPTIDDSELDPDEDGIDSSWEWRWGYDPFTWDDHKNLDPDIDGIENIEEYQMAKWFADPFQPDIYIETDGMEKRWFFDVPHEFPIESQQMIIERFALHGINVYIDDGWPDGPINGGGEMFAPHANMDDVSPKQLLRFYRHNFADERKGIFRYTVIGIQSDASSGFICPTEYNHMDCILLGTSWKNTLLTRTAFTPRAFRFVVACAALHELGHSLGLVPTTFPGNDIQPRSWGDRYPNMPDEDYEGYLDEYESVMNYVYIYNKKLFDYSDGSNDPHYDQNDWDHIYIPTFQTDSVSWEEPIDDGTFEVFEVVNNYPGVVLEDWELDEELTEEYGEKLVHLAIVKNADVKIQIFVKKDSDGGERDLKIFAMPQVSPVHTVWSLVAEGELDSDNKVQLYSLEEQIEEIRRS